MLAGRLQFRQLFQFATGAQSVAGHKPPSLTDTPFGRYAGSLFSAASKKQCLQDVLGDMTHLKQVIRQSSTFRETLKNSSVSRNKQRQIFNTFVPNQYHQITNNFVEAVIDGGRLGELEKIIQTYTSYCKILNKEQDIRIISFEELTNEEKQRVIQAVQKNKPDVKFKLTYEVDPNILGGLQIFAGREFLDCSLRSRLERLKSQLARIA